MTNSLAILALAVVLGVLARDLRKTWLRHARSLRSVPHIRR
jgi:hypothetical protein